MRLDYLTESGYGRQTTASASPCGEAGVTKHGSLAARAGLHGLDSLLWQPNPEEEGIEVVHRAVCSGVIFFDTSEAMIGENWQLLTDEPVEFEK